MRRKSRKIATSTKVLVVTPWLEGGGAQAVLQELMTRAEPDNLRLVVLFAGSRDHEHLERFAASYIEFDEPRTVLGVLRASIRLRREVEMAERVYSLLRGSHIVLGVSAARLLRRREFMATFHQLPSTDRRGIRGRVEDIFCKRAVRAADIISTPAPRARDELIQYGMGSADRVYFDANPVPASFVETPTRPPSDSSWLRVMVAGRLTRQKGIDRLPGLLREVDFPMELVVYGTGEMENVLADMVRSSPPGVHVRPMGRASDMVAAYDDADLVLLPSRWELNPMVIWESWARGRPVVASDIDVHRDLAKEGPVLLFSNSNQLVSLLRELAPGTRRHQLYMDALEATRERTVTMAERFLKDGAFAALESRV